MKRVLPLLGLVALLAGCGGGSASTEPGTLPPVPASPSGAGVPVTQAPTPTPVTPDDGSPTSGASRSPADHLDQPEAFVRHWIEALNRAYVEVDARPLIALSDGRCSTCSNYIRSLERAKRTGEHYAGGVITVRDSAAPQVEDGKTTVLLTASVPELVVYDAGNRIVERVGAFPRATLHVTIRMNGNTWLVQEMTRS